MFDKASSKLDTWQPPFSRVPTRDLDLEIDHDLIPIHVLTSSSPLIPQLQLPVLALGVQARNLDIDSDLTLHAPHILVDQMLNPMIRDSHHHSHSIPLVVTEAVLLHDAFDEFLDGELAEEDGPVMDFGFGGTDVDAQSCVSEAEKVSNNSMERRRSVLGESQWFLPGDRLGEGVLARW